MTKSKDPYQDWQSIPGGFDALNTRQLYRATNALGIPAVPHAPLSSIPDWLCPYRTRCKAEQDPATGALHFFLQDYRFESVWRRPVQTLAGIKSTWQTVIGPDFSLFYDTPLVMQMWNTYRTRWVTRWWSENGLQVIPAVSWASPASYEFCFLGLPARSVLAISTVGTRQDPGTKRPFLNGFKEMLQRLQPSAVLCYGKSYPEMADLVRLHNYPTFWEENAERRKYGHKDKYDDYPDLPSEAVPDINDIW